MKSIFKRALLIVVSAVTFLAAGITASAETKTAELITLDSDTNLAVVVGYEKEEPVVSFISPDNKEFKEGTPGVAVNRDANGKKLYFEITNAKKGKWQIKYDKKSNSEISVDFGKFSNGIWIDSLTVKKVQDSTLSASMSVSQKADVSYKYKLYAALVDEGGAISGTKLLKEGTAKANQPLDVELNISALGSFDGYYLYAEVSFVDNGLTVSDTSLSDKTFAYTNPDSPQAVSDLYAELDVNDNSLMISWKDYCSVSGEKIIAVYGNGETEPFYTYTDDESLDSITADVDCTKLPFTVEFTYKDGERISQTFKKEISLGDVTLDAKGNGISPSKNVEFTYKTAAETELSVVVGENEPHIVPINGEGSFTVDLGDTEGDISVSYVYNNVKIIKKYHISVDDIPPSLDLYLNGTTVRTSESEFEIIGRVEIGAQLTIGSDKVETAENGDFSYKVALNDGTNKFDITVTDTAGNKTFRQIEIIKTEPAETFNSGKVSGFFRNLLPLWITLGASLAAAAVLILVIGNKQPKGSSAKFLLKAFTVFSWVVTALSGGAVIGFTVYRKKLYNEIGPENLAETLKNSLDKAYDKVSAYNATEEYLRILTVVLIVAAVISVLLTAALFAAYKLKNRKPKAKKPPKAKPVQTKPVETAPVQTKPEAEKPAEAKPAEAEKKTPKFCKKCGTPVDNGGKFCKKCGAKLTD